jgi:hypothetical protein
MTPPRQASNTTVGAGDPVDTQHRADAFELHLPPFPPSERQTVSAGALCACSASRC